MLIFLDNYKIGIHTALRIAGYIERPKAKDFIRPIGKDGSRWHAKRLSYKTIDVHYDLNVDGKHVVFDMPLAANAERKRILKRIARLKKYDMTPEELNGLMQKFRIRPDYSHDEKS
jgi:hypothetical protein